MSTNFINRPNPLFPPKSVEQSLPQYVIDKNLQSLKDVEYIKELLHFLVQCGKKMSFIDLYQINSKCYRILALEYNSETCTQGEEYTSLCKDISLISYTLSEYVRILEETNFYKQTPEIISLVGIRNFIIRYNIATLPKPTNC